MIRIKSFELQTTITTTLAVSRKQTRMTKSGNPYLHLDLSDKTGQVPSKVWDPTKSSIDWADIESGKVYLFTARVEDYQGSIQLTIEDIHEADSFDKSDFIATISDNVDELKDELLSYLSSIQNPHLKTLVNRFLDKENVFDQFCEAPAAKSVHDSALGGLLRHTTRLMRLALQMVELYPEINADRDLVITSCFFHDMEKITEYSWEGVTIDYTDVGHFIGHPSMAMMKVYHEIQSIPDFPELLQNKLIHIIASHAAEYDPIRLPSIPEALMLHYADLTDSQLVHFKQEWDKNDGDGWKKDYLTNRWAYYPDQNA